MQHLRAALVTTVIFTLLLGLAYPLAFVGIAQVVAPTTASGSLVAVRGNAVGSALVGQPFSSDRYFWPRPSAAGKDGYDGLSSSGSNLGPTSQKLMDRIAADSSKLEAAGLAKPLPADAVLASASGLDPHISPAFARAQIARVARARNTPEDRVRDLVERRTQRPAFGLFGEPRVNVLLLNIDLDAATAVDVASPS